MDITKIVFISESESLLRIPMSMLFIRGQTFEILDIPIMTVVDRVKEKHKGRWVGQKLIPYILPKCFSQRVSGANLRITVFTLWRKEALRCTAGWDWIVDSKKQLPHPPLFHVGADEIRHTDVAFNWCFRTANQAWSSFPCRSSNLKAPSHIKKRWKPRHHWIIGVNSLKSNQARMGAAWISFISERAGQLESVQGDWGQRYGCVGAGLWMACKQP